MNIVRRKSRDHSREYLAAKMVRKCTLVYERQEIKYPSNAPFPSLEQVARLVKDKTTFGQQQARPSLPILPEFVTQPIRHPDVRELGQNRRGRIVHQGQGAQVVGFGKCIFLRKSTPGAMPSVSVRQVI